MARKVLAVTAVIVLFVCLAVAKVEGPVEVHELKVSGQLADIRIRLPDERMQDSTSLVVRASEVTFVSPGMFWWCLLPVDPDSLNSWDLRSFNGLSTAGADLGGTIVSEMFEVKSEQPFILSAQFPEGTDVFRKISGESLVISIDTGRSAHFGYSVLKPDKEVESLAEDGRFSLCYLGVAVVEGHETYEVNMVELPAGKWGEMSLLEPDKPLDPKEQALALVLLPMSEARYLRTDMDPKQKAEQLFYDITRTPIAFYSGTEISLKPVPSMEFKDSWIDLVGEIAIVFPGTRIITTGRDDTTRIALVDGGLAIEDGGQIKIKGTASQLTVTGKYGVIDYLSRRVSLWNTFPLWLQILMPMLIGALLLPMLFARKRS